MNFVSKEEKVIHDTKNHNINKDNYDPFSENDRLIITDKRIYIEKSSQEFITLANKSISRVDYVIEKPIQRKNKIIAGAIITLIGIIFLLISVGYDDTQISDKAIIFMQLLSIVCIPVGIGFIFDVIRKKQQYEFAKLNLYHEKGNIRLIFRGVSLKEMEEIRNSIFINIKNNL